MLVRFGFSDLNQVDLSSFSCPFPLRDRPDSGDPLDGVPTFAVPCVRSLYLSFYFRFHSLSLFSSRPAFCIVPNLISLSALPPFFALSRRPPAGRHSSCALSFSRDARRFHSHRPTGHRATVRFRVIDNERACDEIDLSQSCSRRALWRAADFRSPAYELRGNARDPSSPIC